MKVALRDPKNDHPEGSPLPYTKAQLREIADHLGLHIDDHTVRYVVGIARNYQAQEATPAHKRLKEIREQKSDVAEAAKQGANHLRALVRLYKRRHGLRDAMIGIAGDVDLFTLRHLFRDGTIDRVEKSLCEAGRNTPKGKVGAPNAAHVTVALIALRNVWEWTRGRRRIPLKYFRDALEPLGYKGGNDALKKKIAEARNYK